MGQRPQSYRSAPADDSRYRVWQHPFYPYGVYSQRKRLQNLNYAHGSAMNNGASQLSLLITCHPSLTTAFLALVELQVLLC